MAKNETVVDAVVEETVVDPMAEIREKYGNLSYAELMDLVDNGELTTEQLDALMAEGDEKAGKSKKKGSRNKRKYEGDTKECQCVFEGCEKMVTVTKFASASKVYCDEHKPAKSGKGSKAKYEGVTKICNCIDCGVEVEVTKFASPNLVRCDECKAVHRKTNKAPKVSNHYLVTDETVSSALEDLRGQKVISIKASTIDDAIEIAGAPLLLTLLENHFGLTPLEIGEDLVEAAE